MKTQTGNVVVTLRVKTILTRSVRTTLILSLFTAGSAFSQEKQAKQQITLHPAAEPVPALKYRLLPEQRDLTPGNAAQLYYRACLSDWSPFPRDAKLLDKAIAWTETPIKDLPGKLGWLYFDYPALREVDRAARRSYCDWEFIPRSREQGFAMNIPEMQDFRRYATLLAARSRYELAKGQFDRASRSYQTGLAMSRHFADGPLIIQQLIGVACAAVILNQVETWIQQPGSPNLYWSLTNLPRPLIDMRKGIEGEKLMVDFMFGEFRDMLTKPKLEPLSLSRARELQGWDQQLGALFRMGGGQGSIQPNPLSVVTMAFLYKGARQFLLDQGRTAAEVDALPMVQVVLIQQVAELDRYYDEVCKWQNVPYPAARAGLEKLERSLGGDGKGGIPGHNFLARLIAPALSSVCVSSVRLERRLEALRVLEALRLYAAAHNGDLPDSLEVVTEVPIPLDPATGKLFEYKRQGDRATLFGPTLAREPTTSANQINYEITMTRTK